MLRKRKDGEHPPVSKRQDADIDTQFEVQSVEHQFF